MLVLWSVCCVRCRVLGVWSWLCVLRVLMAGICIRGDVWQCVLVDTTLILLLTNAKHANPHAKLAPHRPPPSA